MKNLKEVDGVSILPNHQGSCHCGEVKFKLNLPAGLVVVRRCTCSMCRRRGAIVASVPLSDINILQGQDALSLYQFNTMTAKHYFCSHCGTHTHHQRRSNPNEFGVNVGCIEGVDSRLAGLAEWSDGINHPSDA